MKRTHANFVIDAIAFVAFLALMSTGLILNYQLPAGSGGLHGRGTGGGTGERDITILWGWTRHEWGQIHYWIAVSLIVILAMHLVLHWNWIVCVVRGKHGNASGIRFGLGVFSVVALIAFAAAPVLAPTETITRQQLERQSGMDVSGTRNALADLRGSMMLSEVAGELNITPQQLVMRLNLVDEADPSERIGPLLRRHGLRMSDQYCPNVTRIAAIG